jgi:hypothetical protein
MAIAVDGAIHALTLIRTVKQIGFTVRNMTDTLLLESPDMATDSRLQRFAFG